MLSFVARTWFLEVLSACLATKWSPLDDFECFSVALSVIRSISDTSFEHSSWSICCISFFFSFLSCLRYFLLLILFWRFSLACWYATWALICASSFSFSRVSLKDNPLLWRCKSSPYNKKKLIRKASSLKRLVYPLKLWIFIMSKYKTSPCYVLRTVTCVLLLPKVFRRKISTLVLRCF